MILKFTMPVPIKNNNGKIDNKITAEKWKKSFEKWLLKKFIFEDTINNNLYFNKWTFKSLNIKKKLNLWLF